MASQSNPGNSNPSVSSSHLALVAVVRTLAVDPLRGRSVREIAGAAKLDQDRSYRALRSLQHVGWAEQDPLGGWRLSPGLTEISERVRQALADAHRRYLAPGDGGTWP